MRLITIIFLVVLNLDVYSQNTSTVTITSEQLKTTNLIFAEHQMLSETVPLLKSKITNLELINKSWEKTDSIHRVQLLYYGNIIEDKNRSIEGLNKSLKKKQNIIKYGTAGSCVLILLCLLLK